jgi:hypothetical protein
MPVFPSGQLAPVELTLVPTAATAWRMPTGREAGGPPPDTDGTSIAPVDEKGLRTRVPTAGAVSDPGQPVIPAPTAATLLDPFVVRDDRYRRAQEAIDSITISDGRFNWATGGRVAKLSIGSLQLELGLWKHEQVGPSFGPPIPVVNFLKFNW